MTLLVKRQKNDASDAEAICEAASRPTMRFVAVKSETQQARGMMFRTRDLLVRQRTQTVNALRGHFAEFGVIAPQGLVNTSHLAAALGDPVTELPAVVRELGGVLLEQIAELNEKIRELEGPMTVVGWAVRRGAPPGSMRNMFRGFIRLFSSSREAEAPAPVWLENPRKNRKKLCDQRTTTCYITRDTQGELRPYLVAHFAKDIIAD